MTDTVEACCTFCSKSGNEVRLISGPTVHICVECIALCNEIIARDQQYERVSQELDRIVAYGCEPQPYSVVAALAGYKSPRDRDLFFQLGRTLREDHAAGQPLRASLVINKKYGMPGSTYFTVCRDLGHNIPLGAEATFWAEQLKRLTA